MSDHRICRRPSPALQPFVRLLWAVDETRAGRDVWTRREHVLPTGQMHLVIRLGSDPLRLFNGPEDLTGELAGPALVGGARDGFYSREVTGPQLSVGAQLAPGGAEALLGVPAGELAGRHTALEEIWGSVVRSMQAQLAELPALEARLDAFERLLLARLPRIRAMHPAVAHALSEMRCGATIGQIVAGSGYSHRTVLTLFRRSVGLTPKQYARILRFGRAVRDLRGGRPITDVALDAGYSDQAHFSREFHTLAGATPSEYLRTAPAAVHHLPVRTRGR